MASPSRNGVAGVSLAPLAYTLTYGGADASAMAGRATGWFGPSAPMRPSAPPEVAGRRFDYPTGYNLNTTARAYEPVSFAQLRRLADGYDLLRLAIETRKDQAARMRWAIKPRDAGKPSAAKAAAITAFLAKPDGIHPWTDWLRMGLEDVLVLDAWTTFKQRSRAGDLLALEPIDGATIKPILGEDGRVPMPWVQGGKTIWPEAYQQILKGLPAVNYTARELLYRPRNLRTDRVYGFSPVEQVMTTVNIALRRQVMTLEYFTSGTVPDALIGVPETWGPDQIATYQTYWDALFTDNLAARRRARFVPGKVALHQTSEPQLKGEFDEWLARVVCFAFSISPQALIRQMNRASADTQKELAEEEGLAPLLDWIKAVLDEVIADDLGAPELEFAWQEDQPIDEAAQAERLRGLTAGGLMRLNEGRKILGLDPDPSPAADVLMVMTGAGLVPIDANTLAGRKAALDAFGPASGAGGAFGPAGQDDDPSAPVSKLLAQLGAAQPLPAPAHETAGADLAKRRVWRPADPVPFDRPATRRAMRAIAGRLTTALAATCAEVVAGLLGLGTLAKAGPEPGDADALRRASDAYLDDLDFADLRQVAPEVADDLEAVAVDAGRRALAQVGAASREDLVNRVNARAVAAARARAAEMVGMRFDADGALVPSADAAMTITAATRARLRETIASGLERNLGLDAIAEAIEASYAFSEERAARIAEYEVASANGAASLESYRAAAEDGIAVRKAWWAEAGCCAICQANADAGALALDEAFPSGDDTTPAHPSCRCVVVPVLAEDEAVD